MIATVAVPHYKSVKSLRRLLIGLNNQKTISFDLKRDIKVVVVNDDSELTLDSCDFFFSNLDITIINQENQGVASARNKALVIAKGRLIFFLDSDCVPTLNWLQVMVDGFSKYVGVDGIGGRVKPLPSRGVVNEYFNYTNRLEKPIVDRETGEIVTIITANCGFRLDALRKIGGFDDKAFLKRRPGGEDVDLTYRFKEAGYKVGYNPSAIVLHEYPDKFLTIFTKYANYGRGMKVYCLARNIDPKTIKQPGLDIISLLLYHLRIFRKLKRSFEEYRRELNMTHALIFTLFDSIMSFSYVYAFFFKS